MSNRTFNIKMSEQEVDKLLTYIESMVDLCDDEAESQFYDNWYSDVVRQTVANKVGGA